MESFLVAHSGKKLVDCQTLEAAEAYDILRRGLGLAAADLYTVFAPVGCQPQKSREETAQRHGLERTGYRCIEAQAG